MSTTKPIPQRLSALDPGFRMGDWEFVRQAILNLNSANSTYGITAAGTTQATATQLNSALNQIDTAAASTGVNLPLSTGKHETPCQICIVVNNGASTLTVYAAQGSSDTINGTAGATGVSQVAASTVLYVSVKGGAWFSIAGSASGGAVVTLTGVQTLTNKTLTDVINQDTVTNSAIYNIVNTTTLAAVPGLSVAVTTSGTYSFLAKVPVTTTTTSGTSLGLISTAGPVTATTYAENGVFTTAAGTTAVAQSTTFGNAVGGTNFAILAELSGTLVVNTGGTIALGAATNVASTVTSSINTGGFLQLTRIS